MSYESYKYLFSNNGELGASPAPTYDRLDPRLANYGIQQPSQEQLDEKWIESFLLDKSKLASNSIKYECTPKIKAHSIIQVHVAKESLKNCLEIMRKINSTQQELTKNVNTMSSVEWKQKTVDIGRLKDEFNKLMAKFEDDNSVTILKKLIRKREKKRINTKSKKAMQRDLNVKIQEKRLKMHKNINNWLESMKEESETAKLEERMKKDADCVLYEVTKQRSEARKHLSIISALVKLRTVRESMKVQRGEATSAEDRMAFGLVTEKLVRMWENVMQKYSSEEQHLQNMLKKNALVDTKAAKLAKERNVSEEWSTLLFGLKHGEHINNPSYWAFTSAERDFETFVAIRKSWDTFLVPANHEFGSKIPVGWVIPPVEVSKGWAKYLEQQ